MINPLYMIRLMVTYPSTPFTIHPFSITLLILLRLIKLEHIVQQRNQFKMFQTFQVETIVQKLYLIYLLGRVEKCKNEYCFYIYMGVLGEVFVLKSGIRILIQAPEVPFSVPPKQPKTPILGVFGGTENGTWGAQIKILRPLFNTNTPPKTPIQTLWEPFWTPEK